MRTDVVHWCWLHLTSQLCNKSWWRRISLTLGKALHKLHIRLKSPRAGGVALAVQRVQVCSTPHTHVPPHTHLTAYGALWHRHKHPTLFYSSTADLISVWQAQCHMHTVQKVISDRHQCCAVSHLCTLAVLHSPSPRSDSCFHIFLGTGSDQGDNVCRNFH